MPGAAKLPNIEILFLTHAVLSDYVLLNPLMGYIKNMKRFDKTPLISSIVLLIFLILGESIVLFLSADVSHQFAIIGNAFIVISIPFINMVVFSVLSKQEETTRKEMNDKMNALNSSSVIVVFDQEGFILEANENFCITTGRKSSSVIGKHRSQFFVEKLQRKDENCTYWEDVKKGKTVTGEYELLSVSESKMWVSTTHTPINGQKVISISQDITKEREAISQIMRKNVYLEHAARIIRHDMYSGINMYLPRGVTRITKVLSDSGMIKELRLETAIKLINEGLKHTQQVYKGVREFTNLVKQNSALEKNSYDLRESLKSYLKRTGYADQVSVEWLTQLEVNESLFCTAIDNLVRNGLKYNDSEKKVVTIKMMDDKTIAIIDNGRGMTKSQFLRNCEPYYRDVNQQEVGTGLGLSIAVAILEEHGFEIDCQKTESGTMITVKIG